MLSHTILFSLTTVRLVLYLPGNNVSCDEIHYYFVFSFIVFTSSLFLTLTARSIFCLIILFCCL